MKPVDIKVETFSNIAGSYVTATHEPSGIKCTCSDFPSEWRNREAAVAELIGKVAAWEKSLRTAD